MKFICRWKRKKIVTCVILEFFSKWPLIGVFELDFNNPLITTVSHKKEAGNWIYLSFLVSEKMELKLKKSVTVLVIFVYFSHFHLNLENGNEFQLYITFSICVVSKGIFSKTHVPCIYIFLFQMKHCTRISWYLFRKIFRLWGWEANQNWLKTEAKRNVVNLSKR